MKIEKTDQQLIDMATTQYTRDCERAGDSPDCPLEGASKVTRHATYAEVTLMNVHGPIVTYNAIPTKIPVVEEEVYIVTKLHPDELAAKKGLKLEL